MSSGRSSRDYSRYGLSEEQIAENEVAKDSFNRGRLTRRTHPLFPNEPLSRVMLNEWVMISRSLTMVFGLEEGLIVHDISERVRGFPQRHGGLEWAQVSYAQLQQAYPWWSVDKIKRLVRSLEKQQVLVSMPVYEDDGHQGKVYRVDWGVVDRCADELVAQ